MSFISRENTEGNDPDTSRDGSLGKVLWLNHCDCIIQFVSRGGMKSIEILLLFHLTQAVNFLFLLLDQRDNMNV